MQIFNTETPLEWGSLDLPLLGIDSDWHGQTLQPPVAFTLASDGRSLWFAATRQAPAAIHPGAEPGVFTPKLWKHDVSELFIADPDGKRYVEFNLAANGAWWAGTFDSPRQLSVSQPDFQGAVETYHDAPEGGSWLSAFSIPIAFLGEHIDFGTGSRANVAFILNSPRQTFHSACKLPGAEPDFAEGAMIVKELFNVDGELASINVMYKGPPGYDEAFSDWYRASGDETRLLTATGKITFCADCHGAQSTDDFLWGVAADNRL